MVILQVSIAALLTSGLMLIASSVFALPNRKVRRNIRRAEKPKLTEIISLDTSRLISRFIRLQPFERRKLEADLERAGISMTPEEYRAKAIASGVLTASLSIPVFILGIPVAAIGVLGLGILRYYKAAQQVSDELRKKDEEISYALPHFVTTVNEMLKNSRDLKKIFEKYLRDVPNTPLSTDVSKLLARIEANMNMAEALQMFGSSLGVAFIQSFVSGLIEVTKGVDQSSYFERVSADMLALTRENIKRKMAKRPKKIKKATLLMLGCFILVYMTPIVMQLLQGFSLFN